MAASFGSFGGIRQSTKAKFFETYRNRIAIRQQHSLNATEVSSEIQHELPISQNEANYPTIKPKYPPGCWGKMDTKYAWLWDSAVQNQRNIPDIKGRIDALVGKEKSAIVLDPSIDHPASLLFRQYVTKSALMDWNDLLLHGSNSNNPDSEGSDADNEMFNKVINHLKQDIYDFFLMENEIVNKNVKPDQRQQKLCQNLIRLLSNSLITSLSQQFPHLKTCQYDENVIVRSLWSRHGIERKRRKYTTDQDVLVYDTVQDQSIISEGKFQGMLRSHLPLPQFVPRNEGMSITSTPPQLEYKPSAYGHKKELNKKINGIVAGHQLGDPCEFGLVGLLSTCDSHSVEERIGAQSACDFRLAQGLTMSFSWLAAQAVNQGFSHLIDLTYPLTSQTILTDGRVFSFLANQLNTLELWKDDEANSMVNLCWHSGEMPLYHSVENGKVNELNEDVLQTIVRIFMLEPKARDYDMKPTLEQIPEDCSDKIDFVPKRVIVEEIVEEERYIVS